MSTMDSIEERYEAEIAELKAEIERLRSDKGMTENRNEGKKAFEIFFRDLKPESQKNLCETFMTTEQDENWDVFPLFTMEREDREAS